MEIIPNSRENLGFRPPNRRKGLARMQETGVNRRCSIPGVRGSRHEATGDEDGSIHGACPESAAARVG